MSSRTNFESLALALKLKFLVNPPGHLTATQTVKAVKAPCDCQLDSFDSFEPLTLFHKVFIA